MTDDKDISVAEVQTLATRDGVIAFFASLGYRTDERQVQTVSAMGITSRTLTRQIKFIERIALHDDGAEPLDLYLLELTSVTVASTQALARSLRNRSGNYMLVLTDDYERLDFVLIERSLPSATTSSMTTRQVTVRPRILTVDRRNPTQVQMRVLRRFSYTEVDSDTQYDKLLSAYTVAEWSEPLFNNRALFSDYYLNERLPELAEWSERPEPMYHRLQELLPHLRQGSPSGLNDGYAKQAMESVLQALGFEISYAPGGEESDSLLYAPDRPDTPVAVCLSYPWNRYLDGKDEARDAHSPDENPGARVVAALESSAAQWAVVTNGKLWRLYSSRAHSRSTNYYEIDLHETLAMADPNEAFRYFWLFFRVEAFVIRETMLDGQVIESSFLDRVLDESGRYSRALGERLKERVFERVFPHFVAGFIENLKGQTAAGGPHQAPMLSAAEQLSKNREPDEEFRRQVFNGTLTLLYRMLFLLYAESRDLLPVKEARGYWERSLTKIKQDVAESAGTIADEVPDELSKAYQDSPGATELYDRLLALFSIIDLGSEEVNVPLYNGGLFITRPDSADPTQESETARFLASNKIPDRYLALGLDLLARDLDDKRQDLVFIDYKSLGVRQLGSIYEGLLEFRIRIAEQKMAVVKRNKAEVVIPYEEAVKTRRRVLKIGRGRNAQERVYHAGDVYLENDRRERKATGSYYTPDHIVKYIIENTVGPVLSRKFESLRSRFREAAMRFRRRLQQEEAYERVGESFDGSASDNVCDELVDELFDLTVVDPGMGSGHFLVEAVDFICDRILGEREGFLRAFPWNPVTNFLDDTRLEIVAEMERQGVTVDRARLTDINLLKRHVLKRCVYGVDLNPMAVELAKVSLWLDCFTIGAPLSFLDHHLKCGNSLIGVTAAEVESELTSQKKGHVSDLFGGPFHGMLAAAGKIEQIRRIPDATAEQAEQSHQLFSEFEKDQMPYKSALNIWVSQYFGNRRAKEYLTLAGDDLVDQIRSGGRGLSPQYREAISLADKVGEEKKFFHWDLEFPEVFVDFKRSAWKQEQGFDAVVGNPPYGVGLDEDEKKYWNNRFNIPARPLNIAGLFYVAGIRQWSVEASVGMIIPKSITFSRGWEPVVDAVLPSLETLIDVSQAFPGVLLEQVIAICGSRSSSSYLSGVMSEESLVLQSEQGKDYAERLKVLITGVNQAETQLAERLMSSGLRFGDVTETFRGFGWQSYATLEGEEPLLAGKDLSRYGINPNLRLSPELPPNEVARIKRLRQKKIVSQNIVAHIGQPVPHIRIIAALDSQGLINLDTVNNTLSLDKEWPLEVLVALLNSKVYSWFMYRFVYNQAIRTMHFDSPYVSQLPLPPPLSVSQLEEVVQLARLCSDLRADQKDLEFSGMDDLIDAWVYRAFDLTSTDIELIEKTTFHGSS